MWRPCTNTNSLTAIRPFYRDGTIKLHGPEGFAAYAQGGAILAAEILDACVDLVKPGVTTGSI